MKEFNWEEFTRNDKVRIENINVENCQVIGTHREWVEIINCQFRNVIFHNVYEDNCVDIEDCEFINCTFQDTFDGDSVLMTYFRNRFKDCLFENVVYNGYTEQSEIIDYNKFFNCHFRNIEIKGDVTLMDMEINGGSIERLVYEANIITGCRFSNVLMKNILIRAYLTENIMEKVTFEDVVIQGKEDHNDLINCINEFKLIYEFG